MEPVLHALVRWSWRHLGPASHGRHLDTRWTALALRPDVRVRAEADPVTFLRENPPRVILDEVQFAPDLLPYIKERVDEDRSPGRWFDGYVTTITQSVIRELAQIERLAELPRLLRLCAARTATELNVSALASDLAAPRRTTDGYLSLLSTAFLIHLVPAWSTNLSGKVVRRPKLIMADTGLAAHLLGVDAAALQRHDGPVGRLLETFVVNELRKQATWSTHRPSLWHFRDRSGVEVDLVLEHPDGRVVAIEVKATSTPRSADLKGLRFLADRLGDRFHFGLLLTAAPEATPFGPRIAALPVSALWS